MATSSVNITPGVSILGVLGHLNYESWYALAEYVDNALQSAHNEWDELVERDSSYHLAVDIEIDTENGGAISIYDNAGGIHLDDFPRAFRAAEIPPDRTGLSEFGMGMKSASIWFARNWSVETTSIGDPNVYTVEFDMDRVLGLDESQLPVKAEPGHADAHYTRIKLWNLNQIPRGRTLGKIRDHLRDIYRMFLRSGELRLVVAGERMSFAEPAVLEAPDARADQELLPEPPVRRWWKPIDLQLEDGVRVTGFAALREEGSTRDAGFSLFRRGRVILGAGDSPYRPLSIYGRGNSYRSQRLFGELTIDGLPVSHTKDGFQWGDREDEFLELLRNELDSEPLPLLKQAENYRSRTVTRQQARLIEAATASTARTLETHLPTAIEATHVAELDIPAEESEVDVPEAIRAVREVSFTLEGTMWIVAISSAHLEHLPQWMTRQVEKASDAEVRVDLVLNTAHPFVRQFALGDRDSYEAVLRIAVALAVAESLTRDAGLTFVGTMMRNVDTVLTRALAHRGE